MLHPSVSTSGPALLAVLVLLWTTPSSAQADPATAHATALSKQARALGKSPLALGAVMDLEPVLAEIDVDTAKKLLKDLRAARLHPLAHARVVRAHAAMTLAIGDPEAASKEIEAAGFVRQWQLLGPFPNDGMVGMGEPYAPEIEITPGEPARGRHGAVSWRPIEGRDHLGALDPEAIIRPMEGSIVYAATVIQSTRKQKAALRLGASGATIVWLGGKRVGGEDESIGGSFDRDVFGVELQKGDNLLLIKLGQLDGESFLSLRVTDVAGAALGGISFDASAEALTRNNPGTATDDPPAGAFEIPDALEVVRAAAEKVRKPEDKALALARAALVARELRPEDPDEPAAEFLKAALEIAKTPAVLRIASRIERQQWERRAAIERAWEQAPKDPWIRYQRAMILAQSAGDAHYVESWAELEALSKAHPNFLNARFALIEQKMNEGLTQTSLAQAAELAKAHPRHPRALRLAFNAAGRAQALDVQAEICRLQVEVDAGNFKIYSPCASTMMRLDPVKAIEFIDTAIKMRPDITGFVGLKADIHTAADQTAEAERILRQLTQIIPGDARIWQQLGMTRVRLEDRDGALRALRQSLAIEPRNVDLVTYVDQLAPREPSVEETYAMALPTLDPEDEKARFGNEDVFYLVDQKVTRVYPNGQTATFVQQAFKIRTDQAVAAMRTYQIAYTPGEEIVEIVRVRVTGTDGQVRESHQVFEESLSEPWYNLYYDYRALVMVLPDLNRGDVVEVQYKVNQTASQNILGDYFGDLWYAQTTVPKMQTRYVLLSPPDRTINFRKPALEHDYREATTERDGEKMVERVWSFVDVPKIKSEESQPGFSELSDYLHLSTYASWDEIARWYWDLVKDQLVVDGEIRRIVAEETKGVKDRRKKVALLHNYVVENTRYVGLEFGIHGYKPYRTTLCLKRRFGDCKDKASLIKVMLETAGIETNIVLVRTRTNGAITPEPASLQLFDHAIAYVPEFDLFLDGTAEYSGTGELPWGDQGVTVLIVKDGGGHILRETPIYPATDNTIISTLSVDLSAEDGPADASTTISGAFAAGYRQQYGTIEKQKELFGQNLARNYVGASLDYLQFSDLSDLEAPVKVAYRFKGGRLVQQRSDEGLRFLPTLREGNLGQRLAPWPEREQPLEMSHPFISQETYVLRLPAGMVRKEGPKDAEIKSPFGTFSLQVIEREQGGRPEMTVNVTLRIDAHRVSVEDYPRFRAWIGEIDKVLGTAVVVERK